MIYMGKNIIFRSSIVKSIIFCIAILAIIVIVFGITASAEQNPPPPGGGESKGDWIIEDGDDVLRENQEIILEGNLKIEYGGKLTFKNVTLKMKCSSDGEFKISVLGTGEFYIYDNDNNKETTYDASNITAYETKYEFEFFVGLETKFEMKNSELHECGHSGYDGLKIASTNAKIENNTFSNNFYAIYCEPNSRPLIINNVIKNNERKGIYSYRSHPIIQNNLFDNNKYEGIDFTTTNNNIVVDNCTFINHSSSAISLQKSDTIILNCTMESNNIDYWVYEDSHPIVINSTFIDEKIKFDFGEDMDITFKWYLSIKVVDDKGKPNPYVNIRIQDNENGNYDENFITDPNGWVKWINLTEVFWTKEKKTYFTPYTIKASKYGDSNTKIVDLSESKEITIILEDTHPPEIFNVENSTPTTTSVFINWTTNEPSDSGIQYGLDDNYGFEKYNENLVTFHSLELTDLESDTTYHFSVESTDDYDHSNRSEDFIFKTYDNIPPEIDNIQNSTPTGTSVTITWETNEPCNSTVKYGLNDNYGNMEFNEDLVISHEITLTDLTPETLYHFSVESSDINKNSNQSGDFTFKTKDTIPPEITNVKTSSITGTSVKITWNTDEPSSSTIKYGLDDNYGSIKSDELMTNSHSITLTDLAPETLYHFCVNSTDELGNSNQSTDYTFMTADISAPILSDIEVIKILKFAAEINWTTNEPCDSLVKYGETDSYGLEKAKQNLETSHSIFLVDLKMNTTYHFCVNSTDEDDNSIQSEDFSFKTLSDAGDTTPPEGPTFSPKYGGTVNTSRPEIIITFAEIVNITEVKLNGIDISSDLETEDNIIFTYTPLNDLPMGKNTISIIAKDLNGNEMDNPSISVFTIDSLAHEITDIEAIDITQNSVTITWKTNEPSTSQVEYGKADTYGELTDKDINFTTIHNITITGLEIGMTYHYRVITEDENGNENISKDYTFKTLEKTDEPDIDVIMEITPTEIKKGDEVTIKATITNKGTVTIESNVIFMVDDKKIDEKKIKIEAGKSQSSSITWKAVKGNHTIKVVVNQNDKEVTNGTASKNIEVKKSGDDSAFNIIYLIPIIIIPIVVGIGLFLRNRGADKPIQTIQQPQMQQSIPKDAWQQKPQTPVVQPITQPMIPQTAQPAVQICPYCNAQVPGEFRFCNMCGRQIKN